ncbi:DUF4097 family beta strand repeat-containing protein [Actinomadura macra]|uniref:DUF4097 family beta strand repeat-containing protein n=1 Tax=Actinomadura macra TaxID=46164 RepID=UPI000AD0AC5C|nr:DUF4097 family beta strand repeat-containing protein [Actinomadura macra]
MRILIGVTVLAVLAVTLTGCGLSVGGRHEETTSYDGPAGVTKLKVKAGSGRVEIVASDSPGIRVHEKRSWSNERNKPEAEHVVEGGMLSLSAKCGRNVIGWGGACGVSYRVEVPRSIAVEIVNDDGSINVAGLAGAVRLRTGTGAITASDLRASTVSISAGDGRLRVSGRVGTADLRTGTGAINATGLTADRVTARSGDGTIRVSGRATTAELRTDTGTIDADGLSTDRIMARTGDGQISLALAAPPSNVRATTGTGTISVRLPGGQPYKLDLSTGTGGKKIDPAVHNDSASPRLVKLTTGDGSIIVSPA